uniref:Reverse transcriptase domain-containing protein n=1 Tax=Anolis carolinensis TaxID=28377 RepID=A0A803TTP7_ANOCA
MMDYKIYINNVNGLNSPNKRRKIFNQLKKEKYSVILLQETHIAERHAAHLHNKDLGKVFYSLAQEKKRGVAIYVNERIKAELAVKDKEGRFIGIFIEMGSKKILVCNIYAPNGSKTEFGRRLKQEITKSEAEEMLIAGDYNGILDPTKDRSSKGKHTKEMRQGKLPISMTSLQDEFNLKDIWRERHPNERDYTFYSDRHQSWTRIDMIWASNTLATMANTVRILPRLDSDHCPMELQLKETTRKWTWKLNNNLLNSEEDIQRNKKILKEYFANNEKQEISQQIIWDTSKAVMRGHLIQQNAWRNKKKKEEEKKVIEAIGKAEKELKKAPRDIKIKEKLDLLQKQRIFLETEETSKKLKFIKQYNFENANKPGKWLARKLRRKRQKLHITKIVEEGKTYANDTEIIKQFNKFYKKLYSKEVIDKEEVQKYISNRKLKKTTEQQREFLNREISEKEIDQAIMKLDNSKAPGPDGYTAVYYKKLKEELIPNLKKIMNEALNNQIIPESWKEANIVMIAKEDKDPNNVRNYRPISLLNVVYKIYANILAERLKKFLQEWIQKDQTGFLPQRDIKDNLRTILDIIEYYESNNQKELALIFLDAEKAFDNLNWDCIEILLRELDMGFYFINGIKSIYKEQKANISVNGQEGSKIKIGKGTRQGCPLSPLLFIMVLELLLNSIREDGNLQGTKIRKDIYKIRAFADDVVCIVENPNLNINDWLQKIETYSRIVGFKINKEKTKILVKNMSKTKQQKLQEVSGLEITKKIKYLGIYLTAKNAQLLKNNYEETWKNIQKDLKKWSFLNLSLLGRIATIKMNVLPKLLYLFRTIPIIRNNKIFKNWSTELSKFIWQGKKPRVKMLNLTDEKKRGGLGLPDLQLYFEASALGWVKDWATLKDKSMLNLEGFDLRTGWHAYMWYDKKKMEKNFGNHFIRAALIKVWEKYKRNFYTRTPRWISPLEACHRRETPRRNWLTYNDIIRKREGKWTLKSQEEMKKIDQEILSNKGVLQSG